jgi:ribosome biogenesis GTPase
MATMSDNSKDQQKPVAAGDGLVTGRVMRQDAKVCHVEVDGLVRLCAIRGRLFENLGDRKGPVAVGDHVTVDPQGDPQSIEAVLPRKNYLSRIASSHDPREQVLLSNVDHMYVVASIAKPGFSSNRTDRILAACRQRGIPATLIFNKVDIDKKGVLAELRETYAIAGVPILETCAIEGYDGPGMESLRQVLTNQVSGFYGASGVGKSTLLNAIDPSLKIKVGKISKYWTAGKHTTTYSQMHRLPIGEDSWVIDTPGIRVFRPFGLTREVLRDLFPDFAKFQKSCFFPNCTHDHEPDCEVFEALEAGKIAPTRYGSYVEMLDEIGGARGHEEDPE